MYPTARATGPLLATIFAVVLLGESVTIQLAIGAVIVIAGVLCLTGGFKRSVDNAGASLLFGLGAGLLIGSYTVWDAHAVASLLIPPLLIDYASSVVRAVLLAPVACRKRDQIAKHWNEHRLGVVAIAIFNPLAYILVLYAMTFTPVVYVAPVREVSVILTVLAGSLLLGEGRLRERLGWSALVFVGVVLLATG